MSAWQVQFYDAAGDRLGPPRPYDESLGVTEIPEGAAYVRHEHAVPAGPGLGAALMAGEGPWDLGPGLPRGRPERGVTPKRRGQIGGPSR